MLVEDGPRYVRELMEWGAAFDRGPDGTPALALEAAHSARRVLHARDATGREIGRALWERVSPMSNVRIHAHARVVVADRRGRRSAWASSSCRTDGGARVGARAVPRCSRPAAPVRCSARRPTRRWRPATASRWRTGPGRRVADLEFVQFHPTALKVPGQPRFLLSEALRGEGARLVNAAGDAFMTRYDPAGDLAPRDRVARAIVREAQRTGGEVFLSLDHLDPAFVHARFPLISDACRRAGLDLATDRDSGRARRRTT